MDMKKFKDGDKVTHISDRVYEVYDFGYYTTPGVAVIYIENCRNMQDSYAVNVANLRLVEED